MVKVGTGFYISDNTDFSVSISTGKSPHLTTASLGTTFASSVVATAGKEILDRSFIRDMRLSLDLDAEAQVVVNFDNHQIEDLIDLLNLSVLSGEVINELIKPYIMEREENFECYIRGAMNEKRKPVEKAINSATRLGAGLYSQINQK